MNKETEIFLDKDVYAIWHNDFGMNWFLGNTIVKFPDITIEQSKNIINYLKIGSAKNVIESEFELLDIKESHKVIQNLIKEKFLNVKNIKLPKSSKIKQVPLCDILSSESQDSFSGLVIAHHWCWHFPAKIDIPTIKDILRKELGQLCLYEDNQLFRFISCNGGSHLFPDQDTRIVISNYNNINPIRIDIAKGSIHRIHNSAKTLFNAYIGPGKIIDYIVKSNIDLPFSMYFAKYSDPDECSIKPHLDCWTCGRDENSDMAKIKTVAEAVERYASSQISIDSTWDSYEKITSAVHPNDLIQISSKRLNKINWLKRFDKSSKYLWVNGYEYFTKKRVKILSDLVYYPYYPNYLSVCTASSTGVATHQSIDSAVKSAVLELIERDAFVIHWLLEKSPNKINKESLPTEFTKYLDWLEHNVSSFELLDLRIDSIPVFGGMAIKEDFGLWVSAAADCNPKKAMTKVLQELIASTATNSNATANYVMPDKINRVADHEILYKSKEAQKHAMFLGKGNELSWNEIVKNYRQVENPVAFLEKLSPLYIVQLQCYSDVTWVDEKLFTVRALSPYFVPFYFAEDLIPDASQHLKDIQEAWGCYNINLYPHPFA
jgi:thiazole/oxazole-forming peptide maturase SagD family component